MDVHYLRPSSGMLYTVARIVHHQEVHVVEMHVFHNVVRTARVPQDHSRKVQRVQKHIDMLRHLEYDMP
jgi:hypothetical protein